MATEVIKRNGKNDKFDQNKIAKAIEKAMIAGIGKVNHNLIDKIVNEIVEETKDSEIVDISQIEEMVYNKLIKYKQKNVARIYEGYRSVREYQRKVNTIDQKVIGIVKGNDENIKDNSNKNTALISTMRDLVAEEVSKDITLRTLLPADIAQAHQEGLIYVHDMGHYLNPSFNCCLVNLEDMLQNGTVINNKLITKPHTFRTAATIATQVIAQVASGQFGGQTITLSHLAPFVRDSENKIKKNVYDEFLTLSGHEPKTEEEIKRVNDVIAKRLHNEITDGIQTFQYQINTLQTSNGQAPFLSVFMWVKENPEYEKETAMLIEEMLRQRIKGMQNEVGAWITPAFPKLLYVTDECNVNEGSKYYYLTELAAECVAKRMMPDFLSAKKLRENYEGNIFGPMGKWYLAHVKSFEPCLMGVA